MRVLVLCFFLLFLDRHASAQTKGEFPIPVTVSLTKPVMASSTCGEGEVETYCRYTSNVVASLSPNCMSSTCDNTCLHSSSSPSPINLVNLGSQGGGVTTSLLVGPGDTPVTQFSNSFVSIPSSSVPQISTNGFTFAVWIKQDESNDGALISKASSDGLDRTYTVSVTETGIIFDYFSSNSESGFSSLTFNSLDLSSSFWHHIAITVFDNDFALYINGTIEQAAGLTAAIDDTATKNIFLGQIAPNINHYNGLMQNVYFFSQALTAREIEELTTGEFPYDHLQSECRCPPSHPVINSQSTGLCIQHTGTVTSRGSETRLNSLSHTIGYVNDNNFLTTWISETNVQQSNLTMKFVSGSNSAYELIFVFIRYGSPAPKAAIMEKSIDGGATYTPIQYFSDDCNSYFGLENNGALQSNDDVNCVTQYSSQTPTTGVTARIRFTDGTRGSLDDETNIQLQNFVLSDHIRLRMIDYYTMNTTSQHRYYAISDLSIAARCACNGHAPRCSSDITSLCDCVHNTRGDRCEECQPLYNDKQWRKGTPDDGYPCKICDCNNHALACHYNETIDPFPNSYYLGGGGVCDNCQDNTAGTNCETCEFSYYRKAGVEPSDSQPCLPCDCNNAGSLGEDCVKHEGISGKITGQCDCKANVEGLMCDQCKDGFFNLASINSEGCEPCNCNTDGTVNGMDTCNSVTGQCICKLNVMGLKCDQCINGTQGLNSDDPNGCSICNCNVIGSVDLSCDSNTGACTCKAGVTGLNCDQCTSGFYGFSENGCQECKCSVFGSTSSVCDINNGQCPCLSGFFGQNCDQCQSGFFNSSQICTPCQCNSNGTVTSEINNCDTNTGQCMCKDNVIGQDCDKCAPNYTSLQQTGCSECDCTLVNTNTSGVLCDPITSQCACLPSAGSLKCDLCLEGHYRTEDQSCLECNCDTNGGAVSVDCSPLVGQCFCSNENITGQACDQCTVGHYDFPNCFNCQCTMAGSINTVCDSETGVCQCKEFVTGMNCDTCVQGYETLEANNPFGCSTDPDEQSPPASSLILSTSILITWSPPEKPNGVIALYGIIRNGTLIDSVPGSILSYNDTGLTPNTVYMYQVESENIVGSTLSEGIIIRTLEGAPEQVNPPLLTVINSTSLRADWIPPNITNGVIVNYNLLLVSVNNVALESSLVQFNGLAFTYTVTGLSPFTVNTFVLEACTKEQCGSSIETSQTTAEAIPAFQSPPTLTVIHSTSIVVNWTKPAQPNGVIIMYEIYIRTSPFSGNGVSISNVTGDILSFTVNNLLPFVEFEFSIASFTSAGGKQSNWTRETTDEAAPENLFDPIVIPVTSNQLQVQWSEPDNPNGIIVLYGIYIEYPNNTQSEVLNSSSVGSYVVSDLSPFTSYGFFLLTCNTAGCASSNIVYNTTLESAPTGLQSPKFLTTDSKSIEIEWKSPENPNGIITQYSITRSVPSIQSSPARRNIGTLFYGVDFASYPPSNDLDGHSIFISLMFKTLRPDGVLIYSINTARTDMIAIELRDGIPWFIYDAGTGPAAISLNGNTKYNDGKWHELVATRSGSIGVITVDGIDTESGMSIGSGNFIGTPNVLYIGGLDNDAALTTITGNLNINATLNGYSFAGCLFGVKFNENYLNFSALLNPNPGVGSSNKGCPVEREYGISFIGGGYLSMPYASPTTESFSFSVWFRTTRSSSLLFFAYGSDSYIVAKLQNSDLILKIKGVDSNEITLTTSQVLLENNLCNGQWYKLDVNKESDGFLLTVANQSLSTSLDSNININTTSNFYIGGVPVSSKAWDTYYSLFSTYPDGFSGCMRNFVMNDNSINLHQDFGDSLRHVRFDGCDSSPVDGSQACNQDTTTFVTNLNTSFIDSGLTAFTEYHYQVTAVNSAGQAFSSWSLDMTEEDSPQEVGTVSVVSSTSSSLLVEWSHHQPADGIITHYEIIATPISTFGLDSPNGNVQSSSLYIESPIQELTTEITGLEPASNYSLVLQAYTKAGSGTGPSVYAVTLEDVPIDVQTPIITSQGSTEVTLLWNQPAQPNGMIIIYRLYIADTFIMTNGTTVTVDSLKSFTMYEYILEGCTVIGCANSSTGSVFTTEGIPVGLDPPSLIGISSTIVQVSWTNPSEPNGVILFYELYRVFGDDLSQTELVANTTEFVHSVSGLSPSTLYYFRLTAHNSFGSVTSNISSITTPEDAPEQILPPLITAINSSSLQVTWAEPLQPNGIITNYTLFQNGASVFVGGNMDYSFIDTDLTPFTTYTYFIFVCTSKGCGASLTNSQITDEALPESIQQPDIIKITSSSAMVNINAVGKPNGIVRYILRILGEFLSGYENDNRQTVEETRIVFNDTVPGQLSISELVPFLSYSLLLEITNSAGSVFGDDTLFTTLSAEPEVLYPPQVTLVSSTVLNITWLPPVYPNGNITSYIITYNTIISNVLQTQDITYDPVITSAVVYDLIPFADYNVFVTAVNSVGNITSNGTTIMTGEIAPSDFDEPTVISTTSYSIAISWDPPSSPNGIILNYTIITRLSDSNEIIDQFTVPVSTSQYNVTGLLPYMGYNITIKTCNSAGCDDSPSIEATTSEAAPEIIATPTFTTSPNTVTIYWSEPAVKNGIILSYAIYRTIIGGTFTVLDSVTVDNEQQDLFQYTDNNVNPFTTYQYYIEASNSAGSNSGNSSSVLTEEAAPESVQDLLLEAVSSSIVLVTIVPPLKPNGIITKYIIGRYLTPSNIIYVDVMVSSNDSNQNISYTDAMLNPYTVYTYFVTAFTSAGNITSNTSLVQTLEAPPTNLSPPSIILNGDTSILIGWQSPLVENGVITSYQVVRGSFGYYVDDMAIEVYRAILEECCISIVANDNNNVDSSGFIPNNACNLIAETDGDTTTYIDNNLDHYIYYGYCIGAYNGAGGTSSLSSELLQTTPAPQPLAGPNITANAINSTTISISWTEPDVFVLLGPLTSYTLYFKEASDIGPGEALLTGLDQEYIVNGLTPSTSYSFVVEVSNSRGTTFGMPANVTTPDGIPIGVLSPSVQTTSATSILITWVEPLTPNGNIIRYSIFVNSALYHNQSTTGSLSVTGLKPFTTYIVQLEACTELGCARSDLSSNKTFEAAPSGFASPTVMILSPYSATVFWDAPVQSNGIITHYSVFVRAMIECLNNICFEKNLVFSGLSFNYTITGLTPATEYGFEVVAVNGGGNVSSGFTTESTKEAPPTFVATPDVTTISAYSILIEGEVPLESNGAISEYNIYRNGVIVSSGMLNNLAYTDTSLSPYTEYSYILQACTSAGCTNSTVASNTTFEAQPADFIDPIFTNVQSNSLVISWSKPLSPNGIITNYLVSFVNGTIIFDGFSNLTIVDGLSPFTNYSFLVTVCNNADCLDSNTVTTATLEAPPFNMSAPTIKDLSSMSVEVSWQLPSQPNGIITTYRLRRDNELIFEGLALVYDDESLVGDTQYSYSIEAVNSVGSALSPPIVIHTQADIPSNIATPTATVLNSTAIFIQWSEPVNSNGEISAYKLFVNDAEVLSALQFNYTVINLSPFTQYSLYVQVCNQVGCASSKSVTTTTEEEAPFNLAAPILSALSATSVLVSWSEPAMPNGAITTYRVLRRETINPLLILIQYVGGPDITSFTNQDLDPYTSYEYQVVVFNSKGSAESVWTEVTTLEAPPTNLNEPTFPFVQSTYLTLSWEEPINANGILLQYEVSYRPLLGELALFQTLLPNVTQINVTGLSPFTLYEFKITAFNSAGQTDSDFGNILTLEAAPEDISDLILVTKTSKSVTLTWNEPGVPNGIISEYVLYLNNVEEYRDVSTIATIDRLDPFTGYSFQLEACTSADCTRGKIFGFTTAESSPMGQSPPTVVLIDTRSVNIMWDFPTQPNGIIQSYEIFRLEALEPLIDNSTGDPVLIYTTMDVSNRVYNDTTLIPDTGYLYAVRANNSVGFFLSSYTYIQTPQAAPESVQGPILNVLGTSSIGITWDPPGQNNGELTQYQIYRSTMSNSNNIIVYTGLNRVYTDSSLKPYTQYYYIIEACTIAGCTNSSTANATTDQSIPESINTPVTTAVSSSSISVTWIPPETPNGILVSYIVNIIAPISVNVTLTSDTLTTVIPSLEPYTLYTVIVQACTIIGCVASNSNTVTTLESFPMSQGAPSVIALGPSSVDVYWTEPAKPNGIIIDYILRRNNTIVYQGSDLSFIDNNLLPNQQYTYDIQSFTSIGGSERSEYGVVTTHSDTPTGVNPPVLLPLDSTSILATWVVPNVTNGNIQKYILYVNESVAYEDSGLGYVVSNLNIFTIYQFRVEACTSTCGSSLHSYTITKEDIPDDQLPPTLTLSTNQTVLITWLPPSTPNGIILTYTIERVQLINNDELGIVMIIAEDIPATIQELIDTDNSLMPATTYNYRVTASNSVGSITSQYSSVTLPDGVPFNLSAPVLVTKTSTSLTVSVYPPEVANGMLTKYTLFGDNLLSIVEVPLSQMDPVIFTHSNLDPFTDYSVYAEVCTVGGCVLGLASTFKTNEDIPEGLFVPFVTTETSRRIRIEWSPPSKPNGVIIGYQLFYKLPCPQPQITQTIVSQCIETNYMLLANTTDMIYSFDSTGTLLDPHPYTSYQFKLQTGNIAGNVNSTETEVITTAESVPEQINPLLFTVYNDNQSIALNWGSTFRLNGQLKSFTVIRDGVFLFIGTQTYAVFPNQPINTVLQFSVRASNTDFESTSTSVPLEIAIVIVQPSITMTTTPTVNITASPSDTEFYKQPAFIIGMVVLGIILCFVLLVVALCLVRPNRSTDKSDKYDTLRSEKGSPIHDDGTVGSGWTHERHTPVPSYNDALHNYPIAGRKTPSSYSPVKYEMSSQNNSYSPQTKAELAAMYFHGGEEQPLTDTRISRLSVHEDIPMKEFTPEQKQKTYSLEIIDETASEQHSLIEGNDSDQEMGEVKLRKNIPITSSQESMLDTKI